jgi:hypothetical protein
MSENPVPDSVSPWPDPRGGIKTRIDDRFRFYQTRCNICDSKRPTSSFIYFFAYDGHEVRCCARCKNYAPGDITRQEYWDHIYEEPDVDSSLWRYIDLAKFIDMILFKQLWLSQVSSLDDPFEGALGAKARQNDWRETMHSFLFHAVKRPPPGYEKPVSDEYARQEADRLLKDLENSLPAQKLNTYVSCWHIAQHESFLMWKVYAKDRPDIVCIKTNLASIRRCLDDSYHVGVVII